MSNPTTGMSILRWCWRLAGGILALAILLVAVSAASNIGLRDESAGSSLSHDDKLRYAEAVHLRRTLGDDIWPGWGSMEMPQILYNERYAFLLDMVDPPAGWFREPGQVPIGGRWEEVMDDDVAGAPYYRQRIDSGTPSPQAFAVRVGDRWTGSIMTLAWARRQLHRELRSQLPPLLRPLPPYRLLGRLFFRGSEHHISLTLHESFHAFQGAEAPERFAAAEEAAHLGSAYRWDDPNTVQAWRMELSLLADALEATTRLESEILVRRFIEVRRTRRASLSSELQEYERLREWIEGLAKYIELETWRRADSIPTYKAAPGVAGLPDFDHYSGASATLKREIGQLRRSASQGETRFYYTGMAQAMLLDRLSPGWQFGGFNGDWFLEDRLRDAVGVSGLTPGS